MKPRMKLYLCDDAGARFFGDGPCRLLLGVEKTGSLHAAAIEMKMAYTKALGLIRGAEAVLGCPLIRRTIGGKGGGGSQLTPQAKELIERYETYQTACNKASRALFVECFQGFGPSASHPDGQQAERQNDAAECADR